MLSHSITPALALHGMPASNIFTRTNLRKKKTFKVFFLGIQRVQDLILVRWRCVDLARGEGHKTRQMLVTANGRERPPTTSELLPE